MRTIPGAIKTLIKSKTMIGVNAPRVKVSLLDSAFKVGYREVWNSTGTPNFTASVLETTLNVKNNNTKGMFLIMLVLNKEYIDDNDACIYFRVRSADYTAPDSTAVMHLILDGVYDYDSLVDFPNNNTAINLKGSEIAQFNAIAGGAVVAWQEYKIHINTGDIYQNDIKIYSGAFTDWDGNPKTWADFSSGYVTVGFGMYANSVSYNRTFGFDSCFLLNFGTDEELENIGLTTITAENSGTTYDYGYFDFDLTTETYFSIQPSNIFLSKEEAANAQQCIIKFPNVNPDDHTDAGFYSPYRSGDDFPLKTENEWKFVMVPSKKIKVEAGYGTELATIFTGVIDEVKLQTLSNEAIVVLTCRDEGWRLVDKKITAVIDGETEYYLDYPIDEWTTAVWLTDDMYVVMDKGNKMIFTSSEGGPVTLDLTNSNEYTGIEIAAHIETLMNADNTLTGTGTISFTVVYNIITWSFTFSASSGTIALTFDGSTAAVLFGFYEDAIAAASIVSYGRDGTPIEFIVKDLLVRAGFAVGDITVEPTYQTTDPTFERMSYGDAIEQMSTLAGFELIIDPDGKPIFRYPTDRQPETVDEAIVLNGTTPEDIANYPVVTTSIRVYSAADYSGTAYSSATDYLITAGDFESEWTIERRAGSTIGDGDTVYVSYVYAAWVFKEGEDILLLDLIISHRELYGKIEVKGDDCSGVYSVTSPRWDGSTIASDKVFFVLDENLDTDEKCQRTADRLGSDMVAHCVRSKWGAPSVAWLEIGDCVQVIESSTTISEIYRIASIDYDIGDNGSVMTFTAYHYGYSPI